MTAERARAAIATGFVQTTAPPRTPRMTLNNLVKGRLKQPKRVLCYGPEGIGKSTFAAGAPKPIFLGAEDGTAELDVERFPAPYSWEDVKEAIATLTNESHEHKTLVVDTVDWAEPLLWDFICQRDGEKSIESYGYGKGYTAALDEWRVFLAALERLRKAKGLDVVLLAHTQLKPFKNPEGDDFDRYELKLNLKAGGLLKEWCDAVLFTNYETYARKDDKTKRVRGVSTGARLLFTERTAAYDAKNRYSLPPSLPLSWADFAAAVEAGQPGDPAVLKAEIQRKAAELDKAEQEKVTAALGRAGDDAVKLSQLNNYANARLAEQAAKETK